MYIHIYMREEGEDQERATRWKDAVQCVSYEEEDTCDSGSTGRAASIKFQFITKLTHSVYN